MVCDGCRRENAPGAEFCANKDCRAFLGRGAANSQPPPARAPAAPPTATQPGPTRPGTTNPPKPLPATDPGPAAHAASLESAVKRVLAAIDPRPLIHPRRSRSN